MKTLKRLTLAVSLAFVLSASAFAGETNTPPCPEPIPGETNTPPCSGVMLGDDSADSQTSMQSASSDLELAAYDAAVNALESMLAF